jgi:uncharacterized membrane protein
VISDKQVETSIAFLLRAGVLLAGTVVLIGGILYLAQRGGMHADYHVFRGEPADLEKPLLTVRAAFSGTPEAIIELGVLLLILTPISRVVFSVVAFARERDHMYVVMTLIVLAVLLYSLIAG